MIIIIILTQASHKYRKMYVDPVVGNTRKITKKLLNCTDTRKTNNPMARFGTRTVFDFIRVRRRHDNFNNPEYFQIWYPVEYLGEVRTIRGYNHPSPPEMFSVHIFFFLL